MMILSNHVRLFCGAAISFVFSIALAADELPQWVREPLTNSAQIRALTETAAAKALPVRLNGVIIGENIQTPTSLILVDNTGGIFMSEARNQPHLLAGFSRGDRLEVTGVSDAGGFAPMVYVQTVRKLGTSPTPPVLPVTYQQLMTGALDAQWVEIHGVVREYFEPWTNSDVVRIIVSVDGGRVPVRFATKSPKPFAIDSEVRVRAFCFSQYNQKRQIMTPVLQVPRGEQIIIEKTVPDDPYSVPIRKAAAFWTFAPENLHTYVHRIHVSGVVTSCQPGSFLWIRDGATGLRIQTKQREQLQPGDKIEALGFPAFGSYPPALEDSIFKKTGSTEPPAPDTLTNFNQALDHQNDLVVMEATLVQIQTVLEGINLTLEKNGQFFEAVLKQSPGRPAPNQWQAGSRVFATGICSSIYDDPRPYPGVWQPKSFQILLRSPADLIVSRPPPWWTLRHMTMLLGAATGALALMIAVIVAFSRQRLREQNHQRAMAEAEFAAILSERNRLAREIHDTLAQGLAATSVQLRLARKHSTHDLGLLQHHLDTAQQAVRDSLEEARNSIWNMRSQVLETGDLADALRGILGQMANGSELQTVFDVQGRVRRFAPIIENNLLRVGQEAITNATKHAHARQIKVRLDFNEKEFRMTICDDGKGFDPAKPPPGTGGFGLMGMHERARELKGELKVHSAGGTGTEVSLTVPLSNE